MCDLASFKLQRSEKWMRERVNKLKEEVSVLFRNCKNTVEKMNLVGVLQCLGIDHHFEEQINTTLHSTHDADFNNGSLNEVSLWFRLLRQQGFWVPPGTIKKYYQTIFILDLIVGLHLSIHCEVCI